MKTRHYNSLKIVNRKVLKTSTRDRIRTEYLWYKKIKEESAARTPSFSKPSYKDDTGTFSLELIEGENLYELLQKSSAKRDDLQIIINLLKSVTIKMHSITAADNNLEDNIENMYLSKPLDALEYFYSQEKFTSLKKATSLNVNGKKIRKPELIVREVYEYLFDNYKPKPSSLIHGDLTLSNSLFLNNEIFLIDPRGKFGATRYYGDSLYDIAKIYFSLVTNFDSLNHHQFKVSTVGDNSFTYEIDEVVDGRAAVEVFSDNFEYDDKKIAHIVATIWLSLAPHLQESDEQTLVSYLVGAEILNELYTKLNK